MRLPQERSILIIGAGILLIPAIKIAKEMGFHVIATDRDPQAAGFTYADLPVILSTRDVDGHIRAAKELASQYQIAGVFTAGADVEVTVANVARALGLVGVSPEVAYKCNNKAAMRRELARAGVPGSRFAEVSSPEEGRRFLDEVKGPIVVKPLDNCGSRGVKKIDGADELSQAIDHALAFSSSPSEMILLEEYCAGSTHTVETLAYEGTYHLCSIIDTHHGFEPYFVETGHINPTLRTPTDQGQMYELAVWASQVIGIDVGPAKVDIIYTEKGPIVMEMTARLSGGFHCQYTTPLALGTNNIRAAIDIAVGNRPDPADIVPQFRRVALTLAPFPSPGIITEIRGLEEARNVWGVEEIILLAAVGDRVNPYQSSADRVCYIIASGKTLEEARWSALEAERTIKIITVPV